MTKLTLPLEIGKKYVRRDGEVITVREAGVGKTRDCVFVGKDLDDPDRDPSGETHVWIKTGSVYANRSMPHDIVADYVGTAAHPHAEVMMEYAKDAAIMAEPWKNWEYCRNDKWRNLDRHPRWIVDHVYRRRLPKVIINGIECVAGVKEPVFDELYYVASISNSDYFCRVRYTGAYKTYLDHGLIHRTREDAIKMAKALLNFGENVHEND